MSRGSHLIRALGLRVWLAVAHVTGVVRGSAARALALTGAWGARLVVGLGVRLGRGARLQLQRGGGGQEQARTSGRRDDLSESGRRREAQVAAGGQQGYGGDR
jgi:hypothetical protein